MNVLVTGGAGFIGSHLCQSLLEKGHRVRVIDNLSTGELSNIEHLFGNPRFDYVIDTIMNQAKMDELLAWCDEVYHLAAAVGVKLIMEKPVETIETNVMGTEILLKLANRHRRKVLIASTSEIYGKHPDGQLKEDDDRIMGSVFRYRWAYANTKTLDEFLSLAYHREKQLPVVVVRLFNTVGPRQTGEYGMVIPRFVQAALLGKTLTVFGDGTQRRCFTHVQDVTEAMTRLMETPEAVGDIFNVGSTQEVAIGDLARTIVEMTRSKSKIEHIPYDRVYGDGFEDMVHRKPDITKIQNLIGFAPKKTLTDILNDVIQYYRE
jgi:UDP-glucose 4-epimerase